MKEPKQRARQDTVAPSGRGTYAKQACSHCRKRYRSSRLFPLPLSPACSSLSRSPLTVPCRQKEQVRRKNPSLWALRESWSCLRGACSHIPLYFPPSQHNLSLSPPTLRFSAPVFFLRPFPAIPFFFWRSFLPRPVLLGQGNCEKGPYPATLRVPRELHQSPRIQSSRPPVQSRPLSPEPWRPLPRGILRRNRRRLQRLPAS